MKTGGQLQFSPPSSFPATPTDQEEEEATGRGKEWKEKKVRRSQNETQMISEGYESEEEIRRTSERIGQRAARETCTEVVPKIGKDRRPRPVGTMPAKAIQQTDKH